MKKGKTIIELATEVQRQQESKKDFIRPVSTLGLDEEARLYLPTKPDPRGPEDMHLLPVTDLAHRQIGAYTNIPAAYYDRLREEAPLLLAKNVNHWLRATNSQDAKMIRTLDGRVRAFLSDRYRPLENADLAEAVLPALGELGVEILSAEITERRLYIKAVDKRIERDVPTGKKMGDGTHTIFDTLSPAISISNSEVGAGALSVEVGVYTRACTNLAFFSARSLKKFHLGGRSEVFGDNITELLTSETKQASDRATWMQVRDVVRGAFEEARFEASLSSITEMSAQKIEGDVAKFVDVIGKRLNTTEGERSSVLRHLIEGGDLTRYGLFNAFTRTAEDLENYDRATDFERIGGQIIDLPANEWREVARAA